MVFEAYAPIKMLFERQQVVLSKQYSGINVSPSFPNPLVWYVYGRSPQSTSHDLTLYDHKNEKYFLLN